MPRHEVFRKRLAALEPRGGGARTEDAMTRRAKAVDYPAIERQLRTDDGQIESLAIGQRQQAVDIAGVNGGKPGVQTNAGVPRSARHFTVWRRARQGPNQSMLTPAGSHD
jgi:hypothetical protein